MPTTLSDTFRKRLLVLMQINTDSQKSFLQRCQFPATMRYICQVDQQGLPLFFGEVSNFLRQQTKKLFTIHIVSSSILVRHHIGQMKVSCPIIWRDMDQAQVVSSQIFTVVIE